jgi:hypothetical protein
MKSISSSPATSLGHPISLISSVFALLLTLSGSLWASGGGPAGQASFTPNIQVATATPTDNSFVVTAVISPLSTVSEARIEYGLTDAYGGTQSSRSGVFEAPVSYLPNSQVDQVGTYRITFTITGLLPGQAYHYRIFADNRTYFGFTPDPLGISQPQGGLAFTPDTLFTTTASGSPRSFEAWRQLAFSPSELADESISGPSATPQGSSLSNLAKFYFGHPPILAGGDSSSHRVNLPTLQLRTAENIPQASLVFTRVAAATDVSSTLETSLDLATWSPVLSPTSMTTPATGSLETVEVSLANDSTADATKAFYRVKLALTPPEPPSQIARGLRR